MKDRLCLTEPFTYADWRDAFFNPTHPKGEEILHDPSCTCARTTADWILIQNRSARTGVAAISPTTRCYSDMALDELLQRRLFAVTRRSLHADLQILTELGWLSVSQKYHRVHNLPTRPIAVSSEPANAKLNAYDLALVNPDLEIARNLSQPLGGFQRFFLEVDYIISQPGSGQTSGSKPDPSSKADLQQCQRDVQ